MECGKQQHGRRAPASTACTHAAPAWQGMSRGLAAAQPVGGPGVPFAPSAPPGAVQLSPVPKAKHALLAVLHPLKEGPHVFNAADALQAGAGGTKNERHIKCAGWPGWLGGQVGGGRLPSPCTPHPPCWRANSLPRLRPCQPDHVRPTCLQHAQHRLVGAAVQRPVERADRARSHCKAAHTQGGLKRKQGQARHDAAQFWQAAG